MAGDERTVYINGYEWRDVTDQTTAGKTYTEAEVRAIGGDPRRVCEIPDSSD